MLKRFLAAFVAAFLAAAGPAWATTDFLLEPGTNGSIIGTPLVLMTTELNALASGACAVSSVGGTSGVFSQTNTGSGPVGMPYLTSGGSFTPLAGQVLYGWYELSYNGGTNFESQLTTCSTTQAPFQRQADFVIPLSAVAYASSSLAWGPLSFLPWLSYKVVIWNTGTTALPATGNTISIQPFAIHYN